MSKSAVIYIRVSTEEQKLGPVAQLDACRAYCEKMGHTVASIHSDIGVSGAAPLSRRAGLFDALHDVERGGVLVIAKRCRLARDMAVSVVIEDAVSKRGAVIECADGVANGDSPEAQLFRGMLNLFAAYERNVIAARTRAALRANKARGYRAGCVPYGFSAEEDGRLIKNPAEQAVMARVRELHAEGLSLRKVAAALAEEGVVGRTGRSLAHTQVQRIVKEAAGGGDPRRAGGQGELPGLAGADGATPRPRSSSANRKGGSKSLNKGGTVITVKVTRDLRDEVEAALLEWNEERAQALSACGLPEGRPCSVSDVVRGALSGWLEQRRSAVTGDEGLRGAL